MNIVEQEIFRLKLAAGSETSNFEMTDFQLSTAQEPSFRVTNPFIADHDPGSCGYSAGYKNLEHFLTGELQVETRTED